MALLEVAEWGRGLIEEGTGETFDINTQICSAHKARNGAESLKTTFSMPTIEL
jgi:hypothetical protein